MTGPLSYSSDHLVLCVFLSLLWVVTGSITSTPNQTLTSTVKHFRGANTTSTPITTTVTTLLTTKPRPGNVGNVTVQTQNETTITLMWNKVVNISTYALQCEYNGSTTEKKINASTEGESVEYVVSPLTAGTKYNFTLITAFEGQNSNGYTFTAVTAPRNAEEFQSAGQTNTSVTLQWRKVENVLAYRLVFSDREIDVTASMDTEQADHTISNLSSGTKYVFTLFAVFENVSSSGVNQTAVTAPRDAEEFQSAGQTNTSVTLQWRKVENVLAYRLVFSDGEIDVTARMEEEQVSHTIPNLNSGTKYDCTLFAVFENVSSSGVHRTAFTVPRAVSSVNVTERTVDSVTLQWESADKEWTYALLINGTNFSATPDASSDVVSYPLTSLQPGTEYVFRVVTGFSGLKSPAYEGFTVTAIDCASVPWHVTNSSIRGTVGGLFSNATASSNRTHVSLEPGGKNVSFTDLCPGATYEVCLTYERHSVRFEQCRHNLTVVPPTLSAHCGYSEAGYSISIVWDKPDGVWTDVQVNVSGRTHLIPENGKGHAEISGFLPARTYLVSLASLSGSVSSVPFVFHCSTDPTNVIVGTLFALLFFCILVFLVVFLLFKRPDLFRKNKFRGSKLSDKSYKPVSAAEFRSHCSLLRADDHRGYVEEYENLLIVGTKQKQSTSVLPGNKAKNRFVNVLPYNWCRVKLTSSKSSDTSDYINASYIPGYNSNREYIATQGPLPSTVGDFWRMIWEKKVKGIVMVTNCVELGRTKCEQYWPTDLKPCLYRDLLITTRSEHQEAYWTFRLFSVRHRNSPEERTVKQFHFTAWPDHGVPETTAALIEFRRLMRRQIDEEGAGAPTVVHCSAGVGRTGTTIALDVLLQQLEHEGALSVKAFVHKMRLSRPHMVQTESQYIFLHQCIMDCLPPEEEAAECIYENADAIYANAIALREFQESNT